MRKLLFVSLLSISAISLTSCATVFGGRVTAHQKIKPAPGTPQRDIRIVPLLANIVFFPAGLIVDFATGAAYKPYKEETAFK